METLRWYESCAPTGAWQQHITIGEGSDFRGRSVLEGIASLPDCAFTPTHGVEDEASGLGGGGSGRGDNSSPAGPARDATSGSAG